MRSNFRAELWKAFEDPSDESFGPLNFFLTAVTVLALGITIFETERSAILYLPLLDAAERVLAAIFAAEYILRIFAAPRPWRYIKSLYGLIDLLSFLPTFVTFGNFTFLKAARALRVVRLMRLARIAKVVKVERANARTIDNEDRTITWTNARLYLVTMASSAIVLGMLVNFAEPETFPGAISGSAWAISEIMGGGIIETEPVTSSGKAIGIVGRFIGMLLLGYLLNLVTGGFNRKVFGIGRRRVESIRE